MNGKNEALLGDLVNYQIRRDPEIDILMMNFHSILHIYNIPKTLQT